MQETEIRGPHLSCFIWNRARLSADLSAFGRHAADRTVSTTDGGGTRSIRSYALSKAAWSSENPASSTVPRVIAVSCVSGRLLESLVAGTDFDSGTADSTAW
jgi:hypothetical protein